VVGCAAWSGLGSDVVGCAAWSGLGCDVVGCAAWSGLGYDVRLVFHAHWYRKTHAVAPVDRSGAVACGLKLQLR